MLSGLQNNELNCDQTLSQQAEKIITGPLADYLLAKKVQQSITEPESDRWKDYLGRGSFVDTSV